VNVSFNTEDHIAVLFDSGKRNQNCPNHKQTQHSERQLLVFLFCLLRFSLSHLSLPTTYLPLIHRRLPPPPPPRADFRSAPPIRRNPSLAQPGLTWFRSVHVRREEFSSHGFRIRRREDADRWRMRCCVCRVSSAGCRAMGVAGRANPTSSLRSRRCLRMRPSYAPFSEPFTEPPAPAAPSYPAAAHSA
jgi:hypothetical protein